MKIHIENQSPEASSQQGAIATVSNIRAEHAGEESWFLKNKWDLKVDDFYLPVMGSDENINLTYTRSQKLSMTFGFLPFHRIWPQSDYSTTEKFKLDLGWLSTVLLMVLLWIGYGINGGPIGVILGVEALLLFQLYFFAFTFNSDILKRAFWTKGKLRGERDKIIGTNEFLRTGAELCIATILRIKSEFDVPGALKWNLLTAKYEGNLKNALQRFESSGEIINMIRDATDWKSKENGLELLYAMTERFRVGPSPLILLILAGYLLMLGIMVITQISLTSIITSNFVGIILRISQIYVLLVGGQMLGFTTFESHLAIYWRLQDPLQYISTNQLFCDEKSRSFVIDIFSSETLRTFIKLYLRIRKTVRKYQAINDPRMIFFIIVTVIFAGAGVAVISLDVDNTQPLGHGYLDILITLLVLETLLILFSFLVCGVIFNEHPFKIIKGLEDLKTIYHVMRDTLERNTLDQALPKIKFLFSCIKEKNGVDLKALENSIDLLILELQNEMEKHPYVALGVLPCQQKHIAQLFIPILGILWAGIIHAIALLESLLTTSYV